MTDKISNTKIYVITHVPCTFIDSQVLIPIATNYRLGQELGIKSSEEQINIVEYNYLLAEFSTFYWAWKNDISIKIIGFFHYYRHLLLSENYDIYNPEIYLSEICGYNEEYIENIFKEYDLIVPTPQEFETSIYNQYCICHEKVYLDIFMEIVKRKYPNLYEDFSNTLSCKTGYFCNLFLMRKSDFNDYMAFVFDIFEEMKDMLKFSNQIKPFAYLGERIFSCYVGYLKRARGFKIKEVPILYGVGKDGWVVKPTTGM